MLIAIMVLSLGGSIALIAFRSSTQELELSRFTEYEMSSQYLAESGVDQVVSWVIDPASFPNTYPDDYIAARNFFDALPTKPCSRDSEDPDLIIDDNSFLAGTDSPFSGLKVMGEIEEIKFYAPLGQAIPPAAGDRRLCTLEVTAISGKGATKKIRVDLASNPIGPITAGIQGTSLNAASPLPIWVHWGGIRYTGVSAENLGTNILKVPKLDVSEPFDGNSYNDSDFSANIDPVMDIRVEKNIAVPHPDDGGNSFVERPNVVQNDENVSLNEVNPDDIDQVVLRRFLRMNSELYSVAEDGKLKKDGATVGTFDEVFEIPEGEDSNFRLVWITLDPGVHHPPPLLIGGGRYKGYFFFSGDITIIGGQEGRTVVATTPAGGHPTLSGINLEGLFYTNGSMTIQDSFKAYGAFFSRGGFTGAGAQALEVWYNSAFEKAVFPGIRSVTPLSGTWATLDSDHS